MATFRTLPSGKIQVQIRLPGKSAQSSTHPTRELAEQWAREIERNLRANVHTLESLSAEYLDTIKCRTTKRIYSTILINMATES